MIPLSDKSIPVFDKNFKHTHFSSPRTNVTPTYYSHSVTFYLAPGIGYTSSMTG